MILETQLSAARPESVCMVQGVINVPWIRLSHCSLARHLKKGPAPLINDSEARTYVGCYFCTTLITDLSDQLVASTSCVLWGSLNCADVER